MSEIGDPEPQGATPASPELEAMAASSPPLGAQVTESSPETLLFYPDDSMHDSMGVTEAGIVQGSQNSEQESEEDDSLCTIEDFKRRGLIVETSDLESPSATSRSIERSPLNRATSASPMSGSPRTDLPQNNETFHEFDDESGYPGTVITRERVGSHPLQEGSSPQEDEDWWESARESLNYPTDFQQFGNPNEEMHSDVSDWMSSMSRDSASQPTSTSSGMLLDCWGFPVIPANLARVDPDTGLGLSEESKQCFVQQWRDHAVRMEGLAADMVPEWEMLALQGASNEAVSKYACGGLPNEIRAQVWRRLCAVHVTRHPGEYQQLLKIATEHPDCNIAHEDIEKDVERTFPEHEDFRPGSKGVDMLRHVLNAYSLRNPGVGYCQGMNFACALLLLVLEEEEEAYWALSALVEGLVPNYFDELIIGSVVDQCVLASLLQENFPKLAAQMETLGVELPVLCMQWFNSLFIETMPFGSVVCVWDALLSEGALAIMRVGLAIFEMNAEMIETSDSLEQLIVGVRRSLQSSYDGLALLRAAYREGSVAGQVTREHMLELRKSHEKQVWRNLSRCGVPWKPGMYEEDEPEVEPASQLSLPASFVQTLSEAAAELYTGKTKAERNGEGLAPTVRNVLTSARTSVGDVASAAWGGLSSFFGQQLSGGEAESTNELQAAQPRGESALVATNSTSLNSHVFSLPTPTSDQDE